MLQNANLIQTACAICDTLANAKELYPSNFSLQNFTPEIFSARRLPDKIHYRIVRCQTCGLVRSDPIINPETLATLYANSSQTYDDEVANLMNSYVNYLDKAVSCLSGSMKRGQLLEIGCGSGFFLEKALEYGFDHVQGIEPSHQAVEKSTPQIRPNIICDILRPGLLQSEHYDLICMFQVFDHIVDPGTLLDECTKALKPGGGILFLNHDIKALTAVLLGERSPIIDIEHTYLYDQATLQRIVMQHGLTVREVGTVTNKISLRYLVHLLPLPGGIKSSILNNLKDNPLGKITFPIHLGNLYLVAQKM
jgi:SAM-dependent methyltransferase